MATFTDSRGKKIYPTTQQSRSNRIALLINNVNFINMRSARYGAEKDEQAMLHLLQELGYEVVRYMNLTAQWIDEVLKNFCKHPKLALTDSVFVVIMSHGGVETICGINDEEFEIDKIFQHLNTENCPALLNKPKVIIIQACRGEEEGSVYLRDGRRSVVTDNIRSSPANITRDARVHREKDFISFHSSTRHTVSYRSPTSGSFFIHCIVDVFSRSYCYDDIERMFKKVKQCFEESPSDCMQMPTIERNTLIKDFYLFPSQDDLYWRLEAVRKDPFGDQWLRSELKKYSRQITVDMNTVNSLLQLSDDNREVVHGDHSKSFPDHPDRFDECSQLLCSEGLTGRCYWEVEWSGFHVNISVSYRGIRRKGYSDDCKFGQNDQSWSLCCSYMGLSANHKNEYTFISSMPFSSGRAAVYLDHPAGIVSFFKVSSDTLIHLHTFSTTFTEPLYPGFGFMCGASVHLCRVPYE